MSYSSSTPRHGVNLAGAEFGGHELPGVYGLHYMYPSNAVLDYHQSMGRMLIRLPFHWERIQRELFAPLDQEELERLQAVLTAARERGLDVLLDVHNYGRYHFPEDGWQIIGSEKVPYAAYADLWRKLALCFRAESAVFAYGLMNEPHDMEDDARWPLAAQAAIDAIRSVDPDTTIFLAGDGWCSSRNWRSGPNETLNEKVKDPADNLVFEAHCYFDADNSGQYQHSYEGEKATLECGVGYVRPFVEWCQEKGVRGFIGEYGVPDNDPRWLEIMESFLAYLTENGISSTYWAGGPWWGKYSLSIEPADERHLATLLEDEVRRIRGTERPQMRVLRRFPG